MRLCFKTGLVKQGLLHDLSKYSPAEFSSGIKYYQGTRSPNAAEKQEKGYSSAWLHHKGRNKHHYEYWTDISPNPDKYLNPVKMPLKYALEMVCDRIGACRTYRGKEYRQSDPWEYYNRREYKTVPIIHPDTRKLLETVLMICRDEGEDAAVAYMRYLLKHPEDYEAEGAEGIRQGNR